MTPRQKRDKVELLMACWMLRVSFTPERRARLKRALEKPDLASPGGPWEELVALANQAARRLSPIEPEAVKAMKAVELACGDQIPDMRPSRGSARNFPTNRRRPKVEHVQRRHNWQERADLK